MGFAFTRPVLLSLSIVLAPAITAGEDLITIRCEEPNGTRIVNHGGKTQTHEDGYTGARPVFILDPAQPNVLLVLFGGSKAFGELLPEKATKAILAESNATRVVAFEQAGGEWWTYTLHPREGVGFFSKHGTHLLIGPYSATYSATCVFPNTE